MNQVQSGKFKNGLYNRLIEFLMLNIVFIIIVRIVTIGQIIYLYNKLTVVTPACVSFLQEKTRWQEHIFTIASTRT